MRASSVAKDLTPEVLVAMETISNSHWFETFRREELTEASDKDILSSSYEAFMIRATKLWWLRFQSAPTDSIANLSADRNIVTS